MTLFARLLQANEASQLRKADVEIRRYKDLVTRSHLEADALTQVKKQTIEVGSKVAAPAPQPSFNAVRGVIRSSNIAADIGDSALPLHRFEAQDNHQYNGAMVVAGAWLLLYVFALSGFEFKQVTTVLASLY